MGSDKAVVGKRRSAQKIGAFGAAFGGGLKGKISPLLACQLLLARGKSPRKQVPRAKEASETRFVNGLGNLHPRNNVLGLDDLHAHHLLKVGVEEQLVRAPNDYKDPLSRMLRDHPLDLGDHVEVAGLVYGHAG